MPEPKLKDPEEVEDEEEPADAADSEEETPTPEGGETTSDDDYEMAMADQGDIGDPDGFFDGVDADPETSGTTDASNFFDGTDSGSDGGSSDETKSSSPNELSPIAERANETVAKLGVFGLEDGPEKSKLEKEFLELSETVQFGTFTERTVIKHFDSDFSDIDPAWGMIGAALIIAAAVVYKRPDTDTKKIRSKVSGTLGNISLPMMNNDDD